MSGVESTKYTCLHYFEQGEVNCYAISKITKVPYSTVKYYYKKYLRYGSVETQKRSGRPPKVTPQVALDIDLLLKRDKYLTSPKIKSKIKEVSAVEISKTSVLNFAKKLGYTNMLPKKTLDLKPCHIEARLKWAKVYMKHNWNVTVFSDESSFQLNPNCRRVWTTDPKNETIKTSQYHKKLMVWGGIFLGGRTKLEFIQGKVNAEYYERILERQLLPIANMFKGQKWFFQQDNAAVHTAKSVKNFMASKKLNVIQWPSKSPDLNPIENVWAIMKRRVAEKEPQNISELEMAISEIWENLEQGIIDNCVRSMVSRMTELQEKKGHKINY